MQRTTQRENLSESKGDMYAKGLGRRSSSSSSSTTTTATATSSSRDAVDSFINSVAVLAIFEKHFKAEKGLDQLKGGLRQDAYGENISSLTFPGQSKHLTRHWGGSSALLELVIRVSSLHRTHGIYQPLWRRLLSG